MQTTISERGQVSIPASIRQRYNLKPGTGVEWLERAEGIFLIPVPPDPIKAFRQKFKGETSALLRERKRDRKKEHSREVK